MGFIVLVAVIGFSMTGCKNGVDPGTQVPITTPKPGAVVATPTLESKTQNSITINAVTAPDNGQTVEYAINMNYTAPVSGWQDWETFTNLTAGTAYYIFARSKGNNTYNAGTPSAGLQVTTDFANINATVTNTAQWNAALDTIRNGGNGTVENPKNYTITVNENVQVTGSTSYTFGTVSNITITIDGNGKLYLLGQGCLLNIYSNQTVYIDSDGLILEGLKVGQNDSTLNNNTATVIVNSGRLELKNGVIRNNSDGGVSVSGSGDFIMSGGTISGNSCGSSTSYDAWISGFGGGVYIESGTFTMTGGTINNNTAKGGYRSSYGTFFQDYYSTPGDVVGGGGVYVASGGSFTKSGGGRIYENTATGNYGNAVLYTGSLILKRNAPLDAGDSISTNTQIGWGQ